MSSDHYEEDFRTFSQAISYRTMQGYLMVDRNDRTLTAVMYKPGEKVNHLLHLIIALCTCGFWVIIWLILAVQAKKEHRVQISIDEGGNVQEQSWTVN